jgi:hypothetical protein
MNPVLDSTNKPKSDEELADEAFIARARQFLSGLGINSSTLDSDVDLVVTGVLDSLVLLAFWAFVEQERGHQAEFQAEDVRAIRTLRTAARLARQGRSGRGTA